MRVTKNTRLPTVGAARVRINPSARPTAAITNTIIAESRVRRYYRVDGARGYSLTFEAREDVYPSVYQWCDIIAGTLRIGNEMRQPPQQP